MKPTLTPSTFPSTPNYQHFNHQGPTPAPFFHNPAAGSIPLPPSAGPRGSSGTVVAIILGVIGVLVVGVGILAAIGMVVSPHGLGTRAAIGTKDEVYFRDGITEQEATAVGQELKSKGYFTDRGTTVALSNNADGKVISFVVKEGVWNNPQMVSNFDIVGRLVAPKLGGLPVTVRLLDDHAEIKKEMKLK